MPILQREGRAGGGGGGGDGWWWYLPQHNTLCTLTCINSSFGGRWRPARLLVRCYIHPLFCVMYPLSLSLLYPPPRLPPGWLWSWQPGPHSPLSSLQSASAGSVLLPRHCRERAGAGSRNCVVRDNNNNSWIRERLRRRRGYFEPHNHHCER